MSLYIQGLKLPKRMPIKALIFPDGRVTVTLHSKKALLCSGIPVPDHGRLIDESAIDLAKYEKAAHDALHNGKGSILYDSGVLAGARAITQLVRNAPTIIPAEPPNEEVNE